MDRNNEFIQEITGKSQDDCKQKLFALYQTDYEIIEVKHDFVPAGLLGIRKKPVVIMKYVVKHNLYGNNRNSSRTNEQEELEVSRQQILQQNLDFLEKQRRNEALDEKLNKLDEIISKAQISSGSEHETIQRIKEILSENEFTLPYIEMITKKIKEYFSLEQLNDFNLVQKYVIDWIGETIEIRKEKFTRPPHVVIIVGPTGIGKTSTLVKLIGMAIMDAKRKQKPRPKYIVITIDNIRAGSYEQIKKMCEAIDPDTPVKQASTSDDVKEIYEEYKNHVDYIFIDSAGCSPNDSTHIALMKNILDVKMNADIYLGTTASTKAKDLEKIYRNYEPFGYESIIVTKNDESDQFGNIISVLWEKHKTLSYITNGQFVKNIQKANVVDILMNLSGFEIDREHIENKFGNND